MYNKFRDYFILAYLTEFEFEIELKKMDHVITKLEALSIKYPYTVIYTVKSLKEICQEILDTSLKNYILRWASHLNFILISEGAKKEVAQALVDAVAVEYKLLSDRDNDLLEAKIDVNAVMVDPILLWIGLFSIYFPALHRTITKEKQA